MNHPDGAADDLGRHGGDVAPGEEHPEQEIGKGVRGYLIGLALAGVLTACSFAMVKANVVWAPAIPVAIVALAIAQMGVHLVFFLHITTGPDNTNNVMALAFGVLFVVLLIGGSLWIMNNMTSTMMPSVAAPTSRPMHH